MNKILFILLSLFTFNSWGQFTEQQLLELVKIASKKELVEQNSLLLLDGEYNLSLIVSNRLLELEPDNANFNYRKGFALIRANSNNYDALPFLEKAANNAHKVFDGFSASETRAPIDSYFYLARSYHLNNEIEKAQEFYTKFISKSNVSSTLYNTAKLNLKQCGIAKEELEFPKNHQLINLGDNINSRFADYASVVSFDGQALYFTSRRLRSDSSNIELKEPFAEAYKEDVYVSKKDENGKWGLPQLLDFCLPERNEATVAISSDERSIYIYMDEKGNGDIYVSEFKDQKFGKIRSVDIPKLNTEHWEPHISVSIDGNTKYFSSDRPGGYGGRDIYRMKRLPNGSWSEPQNLGPEINTKYDEDAPFISIDNKTLYFSSNGDRSMGGFDIFVTLLDESHNWSPPVNLGYPLNSTGDDIYYTTTANGRTGYLSSFRKDGKGEKDIYEIQNDYFNMDNIAVLMGKIVTLGNAPLPEDVAFTLTCLDCGQTSTHIVYPKITDQSNSFISSLEPCRNYEMVFHYNNSETEFHREHFYTSCDRGYEEVYREIVLDVSTMTVIQEIVPDENLYVFQPLRFTHIFDYNNNQLKESSKEFQEFMALIKEQIENGRSNLVIHIESSASKVPTRTFKNNMELAQKRAENINTRLVAFIESDETLRNNVSVQVKTISVGGPDYKAGTASEIASYSPFQYIKLTISGVFESEEPEAKTIYSKDLQLKGKL